MNAVKLPAGLNIQNLRIQDIAGAVAAVLAAAGLIVGLSTTLSSESGSSESSGSSDNSGWLSSKAIWANPGAAFGELPAGLTQISSDDAAALADTSWRSPADSAVGVSFVGAKQLSISTQCNTLIASYDLTDGTLRTGEFIATKMACQPDAERNQLQVGNFFSGPLNIYATAGAELSTTQTLWLSDGTRALQLKRA